MLTICVALVAIALLSTHIWGGLESVDLPAAAIGRVRTGSDRVTIEMSYRTCGRPGRLVVTLVDLDRPRASGSAVVSVSGAGRITVAIGDGSGIPVKPGGRTAVSAVLIGENGRTLARDSVTTSAE